ncbi:MAG: BlaI/MecI/CopY family transcriptional regulator [Candidatus Aenigmarchaeota archaeon]|nr:BlaI/MecI/CopY family transcriptional regulator [Candidatus Aenigmarchaeota archaeon]
MQQEKSMDTQILEDIGLTNAEIKVYLSLLELGTTTAGPIIEKSGLQSSVVHMTLNKLIEKGFVSFTKEGKRNHYQATNPRHISEYIEEKKERFESLLPQLLTRQLRAKQKPEVVVFKGVRGVKELLLELLDAGGAEHHTFGSAVQSLMLGDAWWVAYHKKRAAKGISAKLLFNESLQAWGAEKRYPKAEVKYTKKGFEPLTETIIRNETVGIILWVEKPIGILINNKDLANSYDQFFSVLWGPTKTH